jgi:hypothetical protein
VVAAHGMFQIVVVQLIGVTQVRATVKDSVVGLTSPVALHQLHLVLHQPHQEGAAAQSVHLLF